MCALAGWPLGWKLLWVTHFVNVMIQFPTRPTNCRILGITPFIWCYGLTILECACEWSRVLRNDMELNAKTHWWQSQKKKIYFFCRLSCCRPIFSNEYAIISLSYLLDDDDDKEKKPNNYVETLICHAMIRIALWPRTPKKTFSRIHYEEAGCTELVHAFE